MRWSKVKSRIRERLASSVARRVDLHSTWYRNTGERYGRAWMTVDGVEVENFSDTDWWRRFYPLVHQLRELDPLSASQPVGDFYDDAELLLRKGHVYGRHDFYMALREYLELSVDDALASANPLVRAIAMLDRKLGKRRLAQIKLDRAEHPLVHALLGVRLQAEGIAVKGDA